MIAHFKTPDLGCASWLSYTGKLNFIRCEMDARLAYFAFADPDGMGPSLEVEYQGGAFSGYHDPIRRFHKILQAALNSNRTGWRYNDGSRSR